MRICLSPGEEYDFVFDPLINEAPKSENMERKRALQFMLLTIYVVYDYDALCVQ